MMHLVITMTVVERRHIGRADQPVTAEEIEIEENGMMMVGEIEVEEMKGKGRSSKLLASIGMVGVDGESLLKALVLRDQVLEQEEPLGVDELEQESDVTVFIVLDQEGEASPLNVQDLGVETGGGNVEAAGIESDGDLFRGAEQKHKVLNQLQGVTNLKKSVQLLSWGNLLDLGNKKK